MKKFLKETIWIIIIILMFGFGFVKMIHMHNMAYESSVDLNVSYSEVVELQQTLIKKKREIISIQEGIIQDLGEFINEKHRIDVTSIQEQGNPSECAAPEDIVSVEVRIHNLLKYNKWDIQDDVMMDTMDTMTLEVHKDYAGHVKVIFEKILESGFYINPGTTKGYGCRKSWFGKTYSMHSVGKAIDINATINPMVGDDGRIYSGREYIPGNIGTIVEGGEVVKIFEEAGWMWMGHNFYTIKDYMHFSVNGR